MIVALPVSVLNGSLLFWDLFEFNKKYAFSTDFKSLSFKIGLGNASIASIIFMMSPKRSVLLVNNITGVGFIILANLNPSIFGIIISKKTRSGFLFALINSVGSS